MTKEFDDDEKAKETKEVGSKNHKKKRTMMMRQERRQQEESKEKFLSPAASKFPQCRREAARPKKRLRHCTTLLSFSTRCCHLREVVPRKIGGGEELLMCILGPLADEEN